MNLRDLKLRARALFRPRRVERELDDELAFHVECETRKLVEQGVAPDDAARQARARFGPVPLAADQCRDARGTAFVDQTARDFVHACRSLRRRPWYALTVVLVLAAGIALATVAFAVVDGVLFKPLPYRNAGELFVIHPGSTAAPTSQPAPVGFGEINAWTEALPDLALSVATAPSESSMTPGRQIWSAMVDERFLEILGYRPFIGGFQPEDFEWGPGPIEAGGGWSPELISYRLWRQEYSGDPDVVGRQIVVASLGGRSQGRRIAGVLPPDFVFPLDTDGVQPDVLVAMPHGMRRPGVRRFHAIVRVPARPALAEVNERLLAATRLAASRTVPNPHGHAGMTPATIDEVRLVSLRDHLARDERPAFRLVAAAAGLMLLLACINVAGLTAASNLERRRELAVRRALGATGWRLSRSILMEVTVLTAAGTALALLLARPLLVATIDLLPSTITLMKAPVLDARVFVTMAALAAATAVLVSLWPVRVAVRLRPASVLHALGGGWTPVARRSRTALIGAQVALGFVLLTAGGLSIASFAAAWGADAGFTRDRMILMAAVVVQSPSGSDMTAQLERGAEVLARVPGVEEVAVSSIQPTFARRSLPWSAVVPAGWKGRLDGVALREVTDNYFRLMDLRLVSGRWPEPGEWAPGRPVAMVSASAARMLWPDRDAIGQSLVHTSRAKQQEPPAIVIGIVADARYEALDTEPIADLYLPGPIQPGRYAIHYHARTSGDSAAVARRGAAALTAAGLHLEQAVTHRDAMFAELKHRALPAWLFGSFGLAALLVIGVGILGMLAMAAAQRTRELGIRIALGAAPSRVVRLFVREQLTAVGWGLAAGALVSAFTVRFVESQLYGVRPYEPTVWLGIALTLVCVSMAGTLVPAIGAARVNPVEALRTE
jgi:predicted permease